MQEFSIGRRRFSVGAVMAAAAALIRPAEAIEPVSTSPPQQQAPAGTVQEMTQKALAKLSPQAQAEVEVKVANIFRKYGEKLSAEQKADIHRVMAEGQEGLEKIRAFVLENGDQPATVFKLYRKEGK